MTRAILMCTNEVFHPRAHAYREGFRHCMLFVWTADGWFGREYRPGAGEIIYPRVAEADDDLLAMLGGNDPRIDKDISRRRAHVVETVIKYRYQWRWAWYRKLPTPYCKHHLGIRNAAVKRPRHLFELLSPAEKDPKKAKPVVAVAQNFIPVK